MVGRGMTIAVIETPLDLAHATEELAASSDIWAKILAQTGPLPMRRKPAGFATLLDAIVGQQVSIASARAIWARVCEAGFDAQDRMRSATPEALAACGLSRPKIRYALALAASDVDWAGHKTLPDHAVISELTGHIGIGKWTAEVYALQALGRRDVFPAGDLALQEAARALFGLAARPGEAELRALSQDWRPNRAVAARALWAYYRIMKNREGIR